jgi:hypothetical protein
MGSQISQFNPCKHQTFPPHLLQDSLPSKTQKNAHMSTSQSSEFCTCHDKIIIHKNNTAKMIDHAKEAFQHEQILLCVNQAKVSIETPLYSWLLT